MGKYNKKRAALMLTGTLVLTGAISSIPMPVFQNGMAAVVYAAEGTTYSTVKGVATMGNGQAHILRKGNSFMPILITWIMYFCSLSRLLLKFQCRRRRVER